MTTKALDIYKPETYETMKLVAGAMAQSGYFNDATQLAQAIVKVQAGAELGFGPFTSMAGIHVIKGKPSLSANLIATLIKNDPRYDYRVRKMEDTEVAIEFFEEGESLGVSTFTAKDAQRANTQNMHKFPRNMLFARAMSNGAKWYTPGVFGGAPVYTPDELGAEVDEDGNIIEGEGWMHEPPKTDPYVEWAQSTDVAHATGLSPEVEATKQAVAEALDEKPNGNGHDLMLPGDDVINAKLAELPKRNATAYTIASWVASWLPYYEAADHALNATAYDRNERLDEGQQTEMVIGLIDRVKAKAEQEAADG